jgi:hypothetical protein
MSEYTADVDGIGTLRLLNAVRACGLEKTCRLYQASTSELYGKVQEVPQSETTPFYPRSPYGTTNSRSNPFFFAVGPLVVSPENVRSSPRLRIMTTASLRTMSLNNSFFASSELQVWPSSTRTGSW